MCGGQRSVMVSMGGWEASYAKLEGSKTVFAVEV